MAFQKSVSGNPKGRPPRPKTGPDKLRADLLRQAPEILARLIEQAKLGDVAAAQAVLSRCLPPLRPVDRPAPIALGTDLAQAGQAVLEALGAGTLTPGDATAAASVLATLARVQESVELADRVQALEAAQLTSR